eukprot:CAMPEP_0172168248 /NCGR_PEP_ID=MMETSP1050-20130122/10028_1 /TAXON_ID=233186 /ORGANISM="Cryptomonas curvata, Strain CCAP979/52" /LENGTH=90 /DNA_ID=CAMNT_0012839141 /DNA_START=77 /DNA_END=346 /DNA_ORIENTATION=+
MSVAIAFDSRIVLVWLLLTFAESSGESLSDRVATIAQEISVRLHDFSEQVLFAAELQALWDQDAVLHPNSPFTIPGSIAAEQAALAEKFI